MQEQTEGQAMWRVVRRTFEAAKHPKGSDERARLNCHTLTSEYYTSQPYMIEGEPTRRTFSAKREAQEYLDLKAQASTAIYR